MKIDERLKRYVMQSRQRYYEGELIEFLTKCRSAKVTYVSEVPSKKKQAP